MSGLLIAAPSSGAGKTTITLGLMRALKLRGVAIAPGKAGPDYIDPAFHTAASGEPCLNYDAWGMRPELLSANASLARSGGRTLVVEAMMGLFDGAADGTGSPADLAAALGLSLVLVVDCAKMSHSVAALVRGFCDHRADIRIVGVILNKVGSDRHEAMLRSALDKARVEVIGVIRSDPALALPERHLGLVQAQEHGGLETFIAYAASAVEAGCDVGRILVAAKFFREGAAAANITRLPPLGQNIAVARDIAFAFSYEHMLLGWRRRGADISFFSPLADEAPRADADAVYLPGGYPELHAGTLAAADSFRTGMLAARDRNTLIYGECGGYMVLGDALVDAAGREHRMLGLLPLTTSFAARKRHLGYRHVTPVDASIFKSPMTAHEFHYASIVSEGSAARLFIAEDATGAAQGDVGLRRDRVAGSFLHLIDLAAAS